jgi:hypothetical protein
MMRQGIFIFRYLKFRCNSDRPNILLETYSRLSTQNILKLQFKLHLLPELVTDENKNSVFFLRTKPCD